GGADVGRCRAGPSRPPQLDGEVEELLDEALAIRIAAAHEADGPRIAELLLGGEGDGVMHGGHAVHGEVVQVADTHALQRAQGVALLREEDVVGLDAVERHHEERIVRKEVDEEDVAALLHPPHEPGGDGPALDDEDDGRAPLLTEPPHAAEDDDLIPALAATALVA